MEHEDGAGLKPSHGERNLGGVGPDLVVHGTGRLVRKRSALERRGENALPWECRRPASSCRVAGLYGPSRAEATARLLPMSMYLLRAAAFAVRPHSTRFGRAVVLARYSQAGSSSQEQAGRWQAGHPVKVQSGGAGGGDVQAVGLFGCAYGGHGGGRGSGGRRLQRAAVPGCGVGVGKGHSSAAGRLRVSSPQTCTSHILRSRMRVSLARSQRCP